MEVGIGKYHVLTSGTMKLHYKGICLESMMAHPISKCVKYSYIHGHNVRAGW